MSKSVLTAEEMGESLTGYDELAIEKAFGEDFLTLANTKQTTAGRSLVFVSLVREGQTPKDAKHAALSMSLREINDYFTEPEEEPVPDDPITSSGKEHALDTSETKS